MFIVFIARVRIVGDAGVLQKAVDGCNCNIYGDPKCCNDKGIFTLTKDKKCYITPTVDETTTGMLTKLPGNNPVQPAGKTATMFPETSRPALLAPVRVYTDANNPAPRGQVVTPASNGDAGVRTSSAAAVSTSVASSSVVPSSSPIVAKPASSTTAAASSSAPVSASPDAGNTFIAIPSPSNGASSPATIGTAPSTPAPAPTSSTPSPANDGQDGDDEEEDCDEDEDDEPAVPSGSSSAVPAPKPTAAPSTTSPDASDEDGDDEDCDEEGPSSHASSLAPVPTPATSSPASTDADDGDCDDEEPSTPASSPPVSKPTSVPSSSDSTDGGADDEDCDDDKPSSKPSSPTTTPASPGPTVVLAPAPAASSAAPSNGSNSYKISYKNGVKCKVRDSSSLGKQFNQYVKRDFTKAPHGHARRAFSHDLSAGRRRFAQSRMQAL